MKWLILALLAGCIPPGVVSDAEDRDNDGYVAVERGGDDCDDEDGAIHPGAREVCGDEADNDCDGVIDDDGLDASTWYPDLDGDGYGADEPVSACEAPEDYVADIAGGADCDDDDKNVHPGAQEMCGDFIDNDCDGATDDDGLYALTFYPDADGDGYAIDEPLTACSRPAGTIHDLGEIDCDDSEELVNPGADEICGDDIDNDCDGETDDAGTNAPTWYPDVDGDGFTGAPTVVACARPADHESSPSAQFDCNDHDGSIKPTATEIWYDGTDQNCDEADDYDQDGDGYRSEAETQDGDDCDDLLFDVNPGQDEICNNGLDDDCDGTPNDCELSGPVDILATRHVVIDISATNYPGDYVRIGDLNNDQYPDVAIGSYSRDLIMFAGPFDADQSLGNAVATLPATQIYAAFDISGDLNDDGFADLLLGWHEASPGDDSWAGEAYVIYGPLSGTLSKFDASLRITGIEPYGMFRQFGRAVTCMPDVNGDDDDELVISAQAGPQSAAFVFLSPHPSGVLSVDDASFLITEDEGDSDANLGTDMAPLSDLTGDETPDLVLGAPSWDGSGSSLNVVSGARRADGTMGSLAGRRTAPPAKYGYRISRESWDLSGDGLVDVATSAAHASAAGNPIWVFFGPVTGTRPASSATDLTILPATGSESGHGSAIATGDINGDGVGDLVYGNDVSDKVYVIYGPLDAGIRDEDDADLTIDIFPMDVRTADFDRDGFSDLVVSTGDGALIIYGAGL